MQAKPRERFRQTKSTNEAIQNLTHISPNT
jgi:hypothetical protein